MNQKGFAPVFIILAVLSIIAVSAGVLYLNNSLRGESQQQNSNINVTSSPSSLPNSQQSITKLPAHIPTINNPVIQPSRTPLATPQLLSKASLVSTSDWQTVSAKNFSIKAPANLVPFVSDPYLIIIRQQKEYIAEKPQYSAAQVGIPEMGDHNNLYTGGSRRQWYLDYHCKYKDEPCPYTFKEKLFGDVNGLEVYRLLEYRDGVNPNSPIIRDSILLAAGSKLFVFNGSPEYAQIIDTSISTLKVN